VVVRFAAPAPRACNDTLSLTRPARGRSRQRDALRCSTDSLRRPNGNRPGRLQHDRAPGSGGETYKPSPLVANRIWFIGTGYGAVDGGGRGIERTGMVPPPMPEIAPVSPGRVRRRQEGAESVTNGRFANHVGPFLTLAIVNQFGESRAFNAVRRTTRYAEIGSGVGSSKPVAGADMTYGLPTGCGCGAQGPPLPARAPIAQTDGLGGAGSLADFPAHAGLGL